MGPRVTVADIAVLEAWMVANGTDLLEKDSYPARSGSGDQSHHGCDSLAQIARHGCLTFQQVEYGVHVGGAAGGSSSCAAN